MEETIRYICLHIKTLILFQILFLKECENININILPVLLFANSWRWDIKIVTFTFYNHFLMKYVAILRKIVNHRRMRWSSVNEMSEEALLNSHSLYPRREGWRTCWLGRGWWGQQDPHKWPEINWNRAGVYAEGHRQGIQVKGLLGRNPERARNGGAENECFEANSTGWFKSDPKIYLQQVDWPLCSMICFWRSWQYIYYDVSYLGLFFREFKHELVVMTVGNSF